MPRRGLCPGVPRRPDRRGPVGQLPPRVAAGRGAFVLSAPLAHAPVLGVPHRVDGPGPDHGDLPGPIQPLPDRPRHQARRRRVPGLGLPGRRRVRRARVPGGDHPSRPRAVGQPDLRHQLQSPAARRPGPRQRQDHPRVGRGLPRGGLERDQGALGLGLGPDPGRGRRRRARPPHDRSDRRRIPEIHRHARRLHPAALLRHRPAAGGPGRRSQRRADPPHCAAAGTTRRRSTRPTRRRSSIGGRRR